MFQFTRTAIFLVVLATAALAAEHSTSDEQHAEVKLLKSDVNEHGFDYALETSNQISAHSSGDEHGNIHGEFSWVDPHGEHVSVSYVADENGYQPKSDRLPTPPPIPEAILKAIAYIEAHPSKEEHSGGRH